MVADGFRCCWLNQKIICDEIFSMLQLLSVFGGKDEKKGFICNEQSKKWRSRTKSHKFTSTV